jgi:hypothetical protein
MNYHVIKAKYKRNHVIWVQFKDGLEGEVNFKDELRGPIFAPLKKVDYFKKFNISGKTLHWRNGADFAPEYLYKIVKMQKTLKKKIK